MQAKSYQERRYTNRTSLSIPAVEEFEEQEREVIAVNISEHGIRYKRSLSSPRCRHQEVFLTFSLVQQVNPIKALGWVVDERENDGFLEAHVTFMFLPEKDEMTIRDYVNARKTVRA